jgi:hypothetical protein
MDGLSIGVYGRIGTTKNRTYSRQGEVIAEPDPRHHQLEQELMWLKRGLGLTPGRVKECRTLLQLPVVEATATAQGGTVARAAFDILTAASRNLPSRLGVALRHAWSVDFSGQQHNLEGRRVAAGKDIGRGPKTVARLEKEAIGEMVVFLLEFPIERAAVFIQSASRGPTPDGHHPIEGFSFDFVDITYTLEGRNPVEWSQHQVLRADRDGIAGITPRYTFPGAPGDVEIFVWEGGKLGTVFPPTEMGLHACNIDFDEPLRRGRTLPIRFSRRVKNIRRAAAPWVGFGIIAPTEKLTLRAKFNDEMPVSVERRVGITLAFPTPIEPPVEVEVSRSGEAQVEFRRPVFGYGYGLAWKWADE